MAAMGCMGKMGRRSLLRTLAGQLRLVLVPSHAADRRSEGWTHLCGLGSSGDDHQRDHSRHGDEYVAAQAFILQGSTLSTLLFSLEGAVELCAFIAIPFLVMALLAGLVGFWLGRRFSLEADRQSWSKTNH